MSLFEYVVVHVTNTFRVSTLLKKVLTPGAVPFFQIPDGESEDDDPSNRRRPFYCSSRFLREQGSSSTQDGGVRVSRLQEAVAAQRACNSSGGTASPQKIQVVNCFGGMAERRSENTRSVATTSTYCPGGHLYTLQQ